MSLAQSLIDLAERDYSINWAAIQRSVGTQLRLNSSFDTAVYDPQQYPSYWCVPLLVGSYVGASKGAILDDTEAFVCGCIIRHFMFEPHRPFDASGDGNRFRAIADAYDACRVGSEMDLSFDARFTAKCLPWMVLLAMGTHSILAEVGKRTDYETAMNATILVHSCLQVIDDWHDKEEDIARSHWNMWVHEPLANSLSVIEPLLRGSRTSVKGLRPHLLRRALGVQLQDAAKELRDVVNSHETRPRLGAESSKRLAAAAPLLITQMEEYGPAP